MCKNSGCMAGLRTLEKKQHLKPTEFTMNLEEEASAQAVHGVQLAQNAIVGVAIILAVGCE